MNLDNYNQWHALHTEEDDTNTPWHIFAKQAIAETDLENKVVLEIGCGRGGFSNYLFKHYPLMKKLYACDYSSVALEMGRSRSLSQEKVVWKREDIQRLSFEANTFDAIISCETIEHVARPAKALAEMYRVLKPGGALILTCPNYFNLFGIWCLYRKMIGKPYTEGGQPYVNYIQLPLIYAKIKTLGFVIKHFHSSEFVIPARVPKTFYPITNPGMLKYFGNRTFYSLIKN